MKIVMLITDSSSYKNYLELYTFIKSNNINIDFSYYFLDMNRSNTFLSHPSNNQIYLRWIVSSLSKYIENEEYGFMPQKLAGSNIFFKMMSNFVNNKSIETNVDKEPFGNVLWTANSKSNHWNEIKETFQDIPKADLYLISMRENAIGYIQFFLVLELYKKYNTTILIGGGGASKNDCLTNLINMFSREYCNNKIYYSVGDLITTVMDFINDNIYTDRYMKDIYIPNYNYIKKNEMNNILKNNISMNITTGCNYNCDYCISSSCSAYRNKVDMNLVKKNILFLHKHFPSARMSFFDNALDNSPQLEELLTFLNKYNIQNKIHCYVNIYKLDNYIKYLKKLNIDLFVAADLFSIENSCRTFNDEIVFYNNLKALKKYNISTYIYHILHVPFYENNYLNQDKVSTFYNFCFQYNIKILHNEFDLRVGSNMFNKPSEFNIRYEYYEEKYHELKQIEKQIRTIPKVFYKNFNRHDRLLDIYKFLKKHKHLYIDALNTYKPGRSIMYAPFLGRMTYMCYIDMSLLASEDTEFNNILIQYMYSLVLNRKGFFKI